MKKSLLCSLLSFSVLGDACSAKKANPDAPSEAAAEEAPLASAAEHCLDQEASACFLETDEGGRSVFYTTQAYHDAWLTNDGISKANIQMTIITDAAYQAKLSHGLVPRMTYAEGIQVNLNVLEDDGQIKPMPGRNANARLPAAGLGKNLGALTKLKGLLRGGAGKGLFSKLFNLGSTSRTRIGKGSIFATLGILLGLGAGGAAIGASTSTNSREDGATPAQFNVNLSFGGHEFSEKVDVEN